MSTLNESEARRQRILDKINKKYQEPGEDSKTDQVSQEVNQKNSQNPQNDTVPPDDQANLGAFNTKSAESQEKKASVFDEYRKFQETEKYEVPFPFIINKRNKLGKSEPLP